MITEIRFLFRFIIYSLSNLFVGSSTNITANTLLLIRLDAIGDYILFRNFIESIKKSEKYKNYSLTLVGNISWKPIAENFDSLYIDNFIWIDRKKFLGNLLYRVKKLNEITSKGYDVAVSPVYSRELFYGDWIIKLVNAVDKIGSFGDLSNIRKWHKAIGDRYYSELVPVEQKVMFEFDRNREFISFFLSTAVDIEKPEITLNRQSNIDLPDGYAVLFIGASSNFRKWNARSFGKLGKYIKDKYKLKIVLCGSASDKPQIEAFRESIGENFLDLVGKTSLLDMFYILKNANVLISNETSIPHIAVALNVKNVFVIYNGNHFKRFIPYPREMHHNYNVIYHPDIEKNKDQYMKISNSYKYTSKLDIQEITYEAVKDKFNRFYIM